MRYVRRVMQILDQSIWIGVEFDEWRKEPCVSGKAPEGQG